MAKLHELFPRADYLSAEASYISQSYCAWSMIEPFEKNDHDHAQNLPSIKRILIISYNFMIVNLYNSENKFWIYIIHF